MSRRQGVAGRSSLERCLLVWIVCTLLTSVVGLGTCWRMARSGRSGQRTTVPRNAFFFPASAHDDKFVRALSSELSFQPDTEEKLIHHCAMELTLRSLSIPELRDLQHYAQ